MSYRLRNLASLNRNRTSRSLVSPFSQTAGLKNDSMPAMSKLSWSKIRYSMISNSHLDQGLSKYCPSQTCQLYGLTFGIIRAEAKLSASSIGALMLAGILLISEGLTWTWACPNTKIAGGGDTQPFPAESKVPNASSATVLINPRTTRSSGGAAKWMKRQILLVSRQRKVNHAPIRSNALIVRAIIKPTPTSVHSGGINSTENGTKRNMPKSVKTGSHWFVLWRVASRKYDFEKPQNPFAKCSQEPSHSQYYPWDSFTFQHNSYPRTALVCHLQNPQHCE